MMPKMRQKFEKKIKKKGEKLPNMAPKASQEEENKKCDGLRDGRSGLLLVQLKLFWTSI